MRPIPIFSWSLALALAACGGGAPGGDPSSAGALLKGNVVAVNGQSADVAGVAVRAASTGAASVTGASGRFDLGTVPPGRQVITVRTSGGGEIEIEIEVEDGDDVHVSVSVRDDGIERVNEEHCGDDGRAEARAALTAREAGLSGHVKVRKDVDGDQGFDVEAEHLAPGRQVDVVVIDADGNEDVLGRLTAQLDDDGGEAVLELRTSDGDRLPFGVADVADLADLRVEVRDAVGGAVLLDGEVPSIGSLPTCDGDDDEDGDDDDRSGEAHLRNLGVVPGTAEVEVRSRPGRGEERLEVEVEDAGAVGTLEAWLEDPASPGTMVRLGALRADDDELELELDTSDGDVLPFGVATAADLAGLVVEVRRASDGATLFAGVVPPVRED